MIAPHVAIDRALADFPASPFLPEIAAALTEDMHEAGVFPRYKTLATIEDIASVGSEKLCATTGLSPAAAEWLMAQIGTEKRKGGWPKGKPRKVSGADL